MRLRTLLLLSLFVAACSHKAPPTPWTGARWGMLPSEVIGAVPSLVPRSGDHLANGATDQFHLDAASVAGTALPAEFFFLESRLVQINFGDSRYRDNAANEKTLEHLAASMRSQYGPEAVGPGMDPSLGLSRNMSWVSGDTQIVLVATPVTGTTSMIAVIYRRAASQGA
jgi:hypothetical protein